MALPTLLLVDAHDAARRLHADLLRASGFQVLEAHNGVEGLIRTREQPVDLVVLDLWPFFSASLQMLEGLRRSQATRDVPVLVVTTPVPPSYRERALAAGCTGFVEKPCHPERVLPLVRQALGADAASPPPCNSDGPEARLH